MRQFSDLSKEELDEFIRKYYEGAPVKRMLETLGVKASCYKIHELFPPEELDECCEYCQSNLVQKRPARNRKKEENKENDVYCPTCRHMPYAVNCNCQKCQEQPERKEKMLRSSIREYYKKKSDPIEFSKLSFRSKVYLGALLICAGDEDFQSTVSIRKTCREYAPDENFAWRMLCDLAIDNAIYVDTESSLDAFCIEGNRFTGHYYPVRVDYKTNIKCSHDRNESFYSIVHPSYFKNELQDDAVNLWKSIAAAECLEYLSYELDLFGLTYDINSKTKVLLRELVDLYSVSQIYSIIWSCVSEFIREKTLHKNKKNDVSSYVMAYCYRFCTLTQLERQRVGHLSRIPELPQSVISSFFFNRVIKIGEAGFYHVPDSEFLRSFKKVI